MHVVCIGGGAASFFFAANASEIHPGVRFTILEQGKTILGKVAISGGGRCNVTHHCFDPGQLATNYPRGADVLTEPFRRFGPADTVKWFENRGVRLKTEDDGRMFPVTDSSATIIDCLVNTCRKNHVEITKGSKVTRLAVCNKNPSSFELTTVSGKTIAADKVFIATGSSRQMWGLLEGLGHTIVPPVPSLFTFRIKDPRLDSMSGVSFGDVSVSIPGTTLNARGPMLITHKGLSGPAILKLSAFGARELQASGYRFPLSIDFMPNLDVKSIKTLRDTDAKKLIGNHAVVGMPKRFFAKMLLHSEIDPQVKFASVSKGDMERFIAMLKRAVFQVDGQNRFKEEFVTAGGVALSEIDLNRFESKMVPGLHLAGEVLNIDAVTGGFNFQAAWTGAYIAARGLVQ